MFNGQIKAIYSEIRSSQSNNPATIWPTMTSSPMIRIVEYNIITIITPNSFISEGFFNSSSKANNFFDLCHVCQHLLNIL